MSKAYSKLRIYNIWRGMKQRCKNPNIPLYKFYGMRGIKYDPTWETFSDFYQDMGASYEDGLTLDRVNTLQGYSKKNCRWATMEQQNNNRRNNNLIYYQGVSQTLSQWAKKLGIKKSTLEMRFYAYRWTIEKCLITPVKIKGGRN